MRPKRVEFEGAIYHVMQRGNNKERIFQGEADKRFFIAELVNSKKKYDFKLFGYVLLDNHYHLLLQTGIVPLSKIMQRQNSLYSRYFNRVHERADHLFGLRYKSIIVEDDKYLFTVLRYLHWNPIKAGIAKEVSDYKWSSDVFYRQDRSGLVDTSFIYNIISDNRSVAINEYVRLVKTYSEIKNDHKYIIGEDYFDNSLGGASQEKKIMDSIFFDLGLSDEQLKSIKSGSRSREFRTYKEKFIEEALSQGYTTKEIAKYLNVSDKAVYKLKKTRTEKEEMGTAQ